MRSAAPTPEKAEAATANRGGLECSSYAWQVRQWENVIGALESQEETGNEASSVRRWSHGFSSFSARYRVTGIG